MRTCLVESGETFQLPEPFAEMKELIPGDMVNVRFGIDQEPVSCLLRGENHIYIPEEYSKMRYRELRCQWSWGQIKPKVDAFDPIRRQHFRMHEPVINVFIPAEKKKPYWRISQCA